MQCSVWVFHRPLEQYHSWVRVDAAGEVVDAIRRSTVVIIIQFRASAPVEYGERLGRAEQPIGLTPPYAFIVPLSGYSPSMIVPIGSPCTARSRLCGCHKLNTRMGISLSMHSEIAVESMMPSRRLSASMYDNRS